MTGKLRLLLLDDEPIVGKTLKPALSKMGCEVEVYENPAEAVKRLEEQEFDIVVTDIRMEGLDGIEVLDRIKKKFPRTQVIMITGYAMMETAREAMEKGAFDFVSKPFEPDELRAVVARAARTLGYELLELDGKIGA
jgi:DNA-binding NtrC family response regulator